MRRIDLSGDWSVRKEGSKKRLPAQVPGCVHADLLAVQEIENPISGRVLEGLSGLCNSTWVYEKDFVSEDFSNFDRVVLRFDGFDGRAVVSLNDTVIGHSTSAFECVECDVKSLIKPGKNKLTVVFAGSTKESGHNAGQPLRRQVSSSLGLWQPKSETVGLCRGVSVLAYSNVRVRQVVILQDHSVAGVVSLNVEVDAERFRPEMHFEVLVRVCYKGNILHEARGILDADHLSLNIPVKNPQYWWPVGMGEQPLYEVTVDVLTGRTCHEHIPRRIGLRDFRMEETDVQGQISRRFFINGLPIFLKGASWMPADLYVARLTRVEYARLVKAAAVANMNCLRVWGGGVYENEAFYDLCDEYGICVWQDMMLCEAQSEKPDDAALADCAREVSGVIRRLHHHPSVVMWCCGDGGGRGVHAAYAATVEETVRREDPGRPCLPPMPHDPFSLGGCPGVQSLPSFPEPRAVAAYLSDFERNVSHPACLFHMSPPDGAKRIFTTCVDEFLMPFGFENTLWLSQIQQALAVKRQILRGRCETPDRQGGAIFWHFNDCWPTASCSSVDADGRWKALHYVARRFFAPLTLADRYQGTTVEVFAFNDAAKPFKGEVQWRMTQMEGTTVGEGSKKVTLGPASREMPLSVKVGEALRKYGAPNLLLWLYLIDEQGNPVAWHIVPFCAWRELNSQPPRLRAEIRAWDDNSFAVILTSRHPALWVWISLEGVDARYDDNFFCLEPERPVRVRVTPSTRMKLDQFRQRIRIGSLRDTWQDKRALMQQMMAAAKAP
ncbi:MAG TPA: glycoside hydrolase family 2 TIM barrel-domain containing protein [Kiritimatiellia bacterium]|nr:glycoside hydrolase family 2 TIM barrel-domain containing protein [Kiritimatiellia bacterium]